MFRIISKNEADLLKNLAWFVWIDGKIQYRTNVK